jgi:hypothetical protein
MYNVTVPVVFVNPLLITSERIVSCASNSSVCTLNGLLTGSNS